VNAALRWRWLQLAVDIFNVTDLRYAAEEYSFVSNWGTSPSVLPSLVPTRHIVAGPPRSVLTTLSLHF